MGPTASGKSQLALTLAAAQPAEIVSVDSAQVYRGMDIGTAKPDAATRARVPHHLIDIRDPSEPYSAAQFVSDAIPLIDAIRQRGRLPLLVGGTMLYFRALQTGLSDLPPADPGFRARLVAEAQRLGWPALHARLAQRDPVAAARLHPNDAQRIQRALEISEHRRTPAHAPALPAGRLRGPVMKLALNPPERRVLHDRIAVRFHEMLGAGLLDEVVRLRARGDLHADLPAMRAVGYRQLWAHLDGAWDLATAVARGIAATRQLAKRQLTWLRSEPGVHWLDPDRPDLVEAAQEQLGAAAVQGGAW